VCVTILRFNVPPVRFRDHLSAPTRLESRDFRRNIACLQEFRILPAAWRFGYRLRAFGNSSLFPPELKSPAQVTKSAALKGAARKRTKHPPVAAFGRLPWPQPGGFTCASIGVSPPRRYQGKLPNGFRLLKYSTLPTIIQLYHAFHNHDILIHYHPHQRNRQPAEAASRSIAEHIVPACLLAPGSACPRTLRGYFGGVRHPAGAKGGRGSTLWVALK
jgi:hypothetical protein